MKKVIVLTLISLFGHSLHAQDFRPIDTLSFANFQANGFTYDTNTSLLIPFFINFDAVVQSGQERINILHIGGSHVQAGTLSHRIRKAIMLAFPDAISHRGMIFPYSVAKNCNNPSDYKVSSNRTFDLTRNVERNLSIPLGVTGIAVSTSDSAEILIRLNDADLSFQTDKIIILGYPTIGNVIPSLKIDTTLLTPNYIDTVLHRYTFLLPIVCDSFRIFLPCDSLNRFTLTGVFLDNSRPGITFHSIGVNGASVSSFLKCDNFEQDLELISPDLVIFGIGINDAAGNNFDTVAFKNNYLTLINRIRRINPDCAFIFITNNDSYQKLSRKKYVVNQNGLLARDVFYRLATMTFGAVWDQFEIMGGLRSMDQWRLERLAQNDRVHFTNKGYSLLGDLFFNAFMDTKNNIINHLNKN
ncbi:MAG: GDSL-type esterase/lipase family protein [Bacteroidales bacterium]|jgi:hypothetical protein|nr:GDSL-type esterase/lipase family protein [Bacteroidales bacterium]